ncbi:NACHT domain-containing protein [Streptomyces prunicolor]|uniref:NACHT domain-containing protein n=1 Tax=Streptomyces prunicolor TaxID=67348 RepID=UPI0037160B97
MVTWLLCAATTAGLIIVWKVSPKNIGNASSVVATVAGLFGVMAVWAWRSNPRRGRSTSEQVEEAAQVLARLVRRQWQDEAVLRQLFDPAPLLVLWTDCPLPDVSDHRQLIGDPVTCRADAAQDLAVAFRSLPRRRLVALGPAGSGKTTLAVLLTLALLGDRDANEPVPVLLSLASFDPSRESVQAWLRRQIAADYPVLADVETFGPSAIEDLLAEDRILPVLDALDERPEPGRAAVLTALNDTLDPRTPLVLTCRTDDYATAVADAGVLAGSAAIAPSPVRPGDALALLRLATPPGLRQHSWDELADHLERSPQGPAAQALSNPLMVTLARSIYADAPGNPAELTDASRFPDSSIVERHLLNDFLPTLYARAQQRDPASRRWAPERAHRYFTYLASRLENHGTYDLVWWQLYAWVPALARASTRSLIWGAAATAMSFPLYLSLMVWQGRATILSAPVVLLHALLMVAPWVTAFVCVQIVGARTMVHTGSNTRRSIAALGTSICGGAAGCLIDLVIDCMVTGNDASGQSTLRCVCWFSFSLLMVLISAGQPAPPPTPSQGAFTLRHWRRRLLRAAITVATTAGLGGATLHLYGIIELYGVADEPTWKTAWPLGLGFGAVIGVGQAALQWTRDTAAVHDLTTPTSSIRADRLVAVLNSALGAILIAVSSTALDTFESRGLGSIGRLLEGFVFGLLWCGAIGMTLALVAYAWPHYALARFILAVWGRLPWRLQAFLTDAHRLGLLRQVGPVYQFRHARLQNHLAVGQTSLPSPRAVSPRSGSPSRN